MVVVSAEMLQLGVIFCMTEDTLEAIQWYEIVVKEKHSTLKHSMNRGL